MELVSQELFTVGVKATGAGISGHRPRAYDKVIFP